MGRKHKLFIEVTQYIQELIDSQQYDKAEQILQVNSLRQFVDNENEEWRDTYIQSIVNKEIFNYNNKFESLQRHWLRKRQELQEFHKTIMSYHRNKKRKTEGPLLDSPSTFSYFGGLLPSPCPPPPSEQLSSPFLPKHDSIASPRPLPYYDPSITYPSSAHQAHYGAVTTYSISNNKST